jgi:hypothetical protein
MNIIILHVSLLWQFFQVQSNDNMDLKDNTYLYGTIFWQTTQFYIFLTTQSKRIVENVSAVWSTNVINTVIMWDSIIFRRSKYIRHRLF